MKEVKIDKEIEQVVEAIYSHASALNEFNQKYPSVVFAVINQFQLDNSYKDNNFIPDDVENLKLRMYALSIKNIKEYTEREQKKRIEAIKKYK